MSRFLTAAGLFGPGLHVLAAPLAPAMFKGNPQLTGVYDAPSPRRLNGVRFTFGAGGPIRSTPAVIDGSLYVGSANGWLYALDSSRPLADL